MKLKELKKMIAEEYSAYKRSKRIKEQGMPELPPIDDMPVDPMAGMGDAPKLDVGGNPLSDVTRELVRYDVQNNPGYYGVPNRSAQTNLFDQD